MFDFLKNKPHYAKLQPLEVSLKVEAGQKLLTAALDAGLDWPHDCRVGSCGTCRCYLKQGEIKPLRDFIYTLAAEDIAAGAILACQSLLKTDIVIEIDLRSNTIGASATEHHQGEISRRRMLTHDIQEVTIATATSCFQQARAGQYAELSVTDIEQPRSYSFARPPRLENVGEVSFFIRHVPGGEFTDWLFGADRVGSEVTISGPYGDFYQRQSEGPMLCIAGGSGLAPIRALVEDGAENGIARDLLVLFGGRAQRDLYCLSELAQLGRRWRGTFQLIPVLSEEPTTSDWSGARGFVTDELSRLLGSRSSLQSAEAYICGPPPMVDTAIEVLQIAGFNSDQLFYDKFEDASTLPRSTQ